MKLGSLHSGGLIPTYCCSSACAHCLYSCTPKRDHAYMDKDTAGRCFAAVMAQGCRVMHIGGGEPFLRPEGLYDVLDAACEAGMTIEYVETNSSWVTGLERTREILREIRRRGIGTLLLSISPFHNAYIPFRKVGGLMEACDAEGISIFPWTMEMARDVRALDPDRKHSLSEYQDKFGKDYVMKAMDRYGVIPGGAALKTLEPWMQRRPVQEILSRQSPCARLTGTMHFHVDLYENYVPCQCPGLSVRLEDIGGELDRQEYPILNALVGGGIQALCEIATRDHGYEPSPEGYTMPCELCHDIRRFLALDRNIDSHELEPVEFYDAP